MKQIFHILRYIYRNNPWYAFLPKLCQSFFYQCYKRLTKRIFTKTLFNGKRIFLYPHSPVSSAFIYSSYPDKEEIQILRQYADANTVFLDVGSNIGAYSVLLMDKVKAVYAFEAHPITVNYCKMNFLLNNVSEHYVIEKAVSENCEPKYFSDNHNASPINARVMDATQAIKVQATTLDAFVEEQQFEPETQFILKVDVEGFEHEVFEGAKAFLANSAVRAIIFETFSAKNKEIVELFKRLGYRLQGIGDNNMLAYR